MTPCLLLLTPFMSSIQVQWVMIWCANRSWQPNCAHPCQILELMLMVKVWHCSAAKFEPKPTPFTVMRPCLLLLTPFMSSIQVQWWVMIWCAITGPGSPTVPTHVSRFWTDADAGQKFGIALRPNLSQNPHHSQSWHHVCCCWLLSCPPYRSNGWWFMMC
jgi:hypothetical protein